MLTIWQALRRYALSTLINNLLGSEKPIPLEFLINGSYLRSTIDKFLATNGISAETILNVEYVRALIPPLHVASFEHDDWVSSVDVLSNSSPACAGTKAVVAQGEQRILSGSYDGFLRIWNTSSQVLAVSPGPNLGGHTSPIKATTYISPTQIASSGLDRTIRIWRYREEDDGLSCSIIPQLELYGHQGGVDSMAVHAPSHRILSVSSDHSVGLWTVKKSEAPQAPTALLPSAALRSSKKRKLNSSVQVPQRGPLAMMKKHFGPVSSSLFDENDSTVGYSTSWDHTLRTWDLVTTELVDTRTTSHALLSCAQLPYIHLLAAGTSARHITMVDPRDSATTVSAMTLRGHTNAVVTLARDPESEYGLVSGSHDGTCKVWDVRSTKNGKGGVVAESIYSIERESVRGQGRRLGGEGIKVFGVLWDKDIGIVSASEDKRVQINRAAGVASKKAAAG